ncbi:MAG: hypothetical protein ACR2K2_16305 [Mycobacteriales bacterium]
MPALLQRLSRLAGELDPDLALLAGPAEAAIGTGALAAAAERVVGVGRAAAGIRAAATTQQATVAAGDVAALNADVDAQAERLHAWVEAYRELGSGRA